MVLSEDWWLHMAWVIGWDCLKAIHSRLKALMVRLMIQAAELMARLHGIPIFLISEAYITSLAKTADLSSKNLFRRSY